MKPSRAFVACSLLLGACFPAAAQEPAKPAVAGDIGAAYSELEMRARLAITPDSRCEDDECIAAQAFRTRVQEIGQRVSDGAYSLAFETNLQVPSFLVTVPGKDDIGTLSSATGTVIVFDGLRTLRPQDPLLAFLIAREMGHILARHHEENSGISIGVSIAVSLIFPVANLLRGVEVAAAATTSSLASTAVSMVGSRIVRGLYKADQQREADILALSILAHSGWSAFDVAEALQASMPLVIGEGWMAELRESRHWIDQVAVGPPLPPPVAEVPPPEPEPELPVEMSVADFSAVGVSGDAHEMHWGAVWRQGAWRDALMCMPLTPLDEPVKTFDEAERPARSAVTCVLRGKAAKRCVSTVRQTTVKKSKAKALKPVVRTKAVKRKRR